MSRRNRGQNWTAGEGDEPQDAADEQREQGPTNPVLDFGGPPPPKVAEAPADAAPGDEPTPSEDSELDRLRREVAEQKRLLAELADAGIEGQERAAGLILPKGYRIKAHAMKRHKRGTILRADQFPPGVLERMQRDGRVAPVFNLPEGYEFPPEPTPKAEVVAQAEAKAKAE